MRTSKYTVEQIIGFLREAQGDVSVQEVCRRHNLSTTSFYKWRRQYGGLELSEARRLKALAEENTRLKRLVADQAVKIQILEEVSSKKW
ncbi:MAG: transposase [Burkholderiales bacterium]